MAFIKAKLDDVHESQPVPEGEYSLRITRAEQRDSKKGQPMIEVRLKIEDKDYPNASLIYHYLLSPDGCEADVAYLRKLEWKRFCATFDLPLNCDADDMPGQTGECFVTQEEDDNGVPRNRLRLPRLRD